ncbi:MAG: hypothetical protein Q4A32_02285 [Lachnospiraceae bacterium]|nr:hypothetical protein [Lachnospiraceae bacterium]
MSIYLNFAPLITVHASTVALVILSAAKDLYHHKGLGMNETRKSLSS